MPTKPPVLIVGAGPTGLNLALSLSRRGVPFRLVSDADGPGLHSRAMVVQVRTLELYDQYGFANEVIDRGVAIETAHIPDGEAISFKDLGGSISPFPFALSYPQDDHERFLLGKLSEAGVEVEWRSKLTGFAQTECEVRATISRDGRTEEIVADYICGCDGAHSVVRETLGIGFPGGTYDQLFYVADVEINRAFEPDLWFALGAHVLVLMFPVRSSGMQRLIGLVPPELSSRTDLTFEDVRQQAQALMHIEVANVNWFSTYRVHHRVAEHFRGGRAFLLGDAAHIHSPVGGQGMNTGIGDAINLGWKLAQVIQGRATPSLLDSYEGERIGFARSLVATTDRAFTPLVAKGVAGELARRVLVPLVFSVALRVPMTRHEIFRTVSQTRIHYPDSPLSAGKAGHVHGGDRLPWVGPGLGNFAALRSLDWQVHVYGEMASELSSVCRNLHLDTHEFAWGERAHDAGFARDAMYLVRPDGYVAMAMPEQSAGALKEYLSALAPGGVGV